MIGYWLEEIWEGRQVKVRREGEWDRPPTIFGFKVSVRYPLGLSIFLVKRSAI